MCARTQEMYYLGVEEVLQRIFSDPLAWEAVREGQRRGPGQYCSSNEAERLKDLTAMKAFTQAVLLVQLAFDQCQANNSGQQKMGLLLLRWAHLYFVHTLANVHTGG